MKQKVQDEVKQFMAHFVKDNVYDTALDEIFRIEPVQAFIQNKSRAQQGVLKEHVCQITRLNFFLYFMNLLFKQSIRTVAFYQNAVSGAGK